MYDLKLKLGKKLENFLGEREMPSAIENVLFCCLRQFSFPDKG